MSVAKSIFISLFLVPFLAFAQNQAVLPNAGLTPESPFYFLDKFGEGLRAFFTFNPEGKARLQITFAAERISEVKVILETKGVKAPGLEVAQSRLQAHLASVAAVLDSEKAKGRDISKLASELDDKFEGPKSAFEETFKTQKRAFESQEDTLKAKIRDARRTGDTAQVKTLTEQLAEVKIQKELLEQEGDDQEEALEKEEERIKEKMEVKTKAEKKIRKAEREKQEVLAEAAKEGVIIPAQAFNAFDDHIAKAKLAFGAGEFEEAKLHAEKAKESLDKVEDAIEELGEAKEEEEELKEEQERKEPEVREKQDERMREDVKTVFMHSGRFDDSTVDVKRGDTVRWINRDTKPHWPASDPHPVHTNLSGFDALRPINPGESYEFIFKQQGIFVYHDHLNPAAGGTIIVK